MVHKRIKSLAKRLQNALIATFFVGTQLLLPLALSGVAHADAGATLEQCRNGSIASPDLCNDSSQNTGWVAGNAGASDSHWREGDSLPYRMLFSGLSTSGSHSVTIQWDTLQNGKHALDYLTSFDRTSTTANPCFGVSGCGAPMEYHIPSDSNITNAGVTQVSGNFTLYNGVITSVSGYTTSTSNSGSDASESITIDFTASNSTPVLAWGGHIASQIDWGVGNSAGAINGSSYHTRLLDLDGSGGNQDRSLSAAAVFPTPSIITQTSVANVYVGNSVTDSATLSGPSSPLTGTVSFYVCGPAVSAPDCSSSNSGVAVTGNPVPLNVVNAAGKNTDAVSVATSGTYTPSAPGTYCFRADYLPASDAPYSPQSETNQNTTPPYNECFVATYAPSTLTIVKDVINDNGGTATANDFTLTVNGSALTGGTLSNNNLTDTYVYSNPQAGVSYDVEENDPTALGYGQTSLICKDSMGNTVGDPVILDHGESVTCTITNDDIAPTLTLVKKVIGGTALPTDWTLTATGPTTISGITGSSAISGATVSAGNYTLSESGGPLGYTSDGWNCTGGTLNGDVLTLPLNTNATCTVTNVRDTGSLSVTKALVPASDPGLFDLNINGVSYASNVGNGGTTGNQSVDTGSYYVSETAGTNTTLNNYSSTYLCLDGSTVVVSGSGTSSPDFNVAKGQTIACTFTNTRYGSISGTKYLVNADGTHVGTIQDWTIYLLLNGSPINQTTTDSSGNYSFNTLLPGNYTVKEDISNTSYTQLYGWPGSTCLLPSYNLDLYPGGVNSTANDFCNFQNGSISGYKYNDINGNGQYDPASEPKLANWTIDLLNSSGSIIDHTVTDATGNYSFNNVAPGTYQVCEVMQPGWVQTQPGTQSGCYTVDMANSDQQSTAVFGNQGQGSIEVIKNVIGADGTTTRNVTTWQWTLAGTNSNYPGSTNQTGTTLSNLPADTYTVSEVSQPHYHFVSLACTDNNTSMTGLTDAASTQVTLNPGDSIVCTFTNARNTGTVTVNKTLIPSSDPGLFDLNINNTAYASNVGNNGTTHSQTVATGNVTVSETAGTGTNMSDYSSTYSCNNGNTPVTSGSGTSASFTLNYLDNVVCTFTNTRLASLTIVKDANPKSSQSFSFQFGISQISNVQQLLNINSATDFSLVDNGTNNQNSKTFTDLTPGTSYYVTENSLNGWDLSNINCGSGVQFTQSGSTITISLTAGQNVTCTFTNNQLVGKVLGASTVLVNTGTHLTPLEFVIPVILAVSVSSVYLISRSTRTRDSSGK